MELLALILVVCVIILFFQINSLKKRLKSLENRLPVDTTAQQIQTVAATSTNPEPQKEAPWTPPEKDGDVKLKRLIATPTAGGDPQPEQNPRTFVFRGDLLKSFTDWLTANWFYALAAISLALAGIFLIQYSVESGLLSPPLRVLGALIMGGGLIMGAEYLRRKGSDEAGSLAYLPSTFAAGGFITLFAAIWGAYSLYGLIGPLLGFLLLALIGFAAILCGWIYGPLVSAIGTIGAITTPFLLGGESDNTHLLMPYFAAVTAGALTIDAFKRWAWLSTLAIVLGLGASTLIFMATQARPTYLMTMIGFVLLATIIPVKSLLPSHNGPSLLASLARNFISNGTKIWPGFPPRLALATLIAASGAVLFAYHPEVAIFWVCLLTIGALLLMTLLWMSKPEGLEDAVLAPAIGLLALAALASPKVDYTLWRTAQLGEEAAYNDIIRPVLALGIVALLVSALAGWRSLGRTSHPRAWSVGAITFAPIMAVLLEVLWGPTVQLGRPLWALCLITIAALMTWLTTRYARTDGEDRLRTSLALCAAIVMISFAVVTLLSEAALTIALALTTAITAYIAANQKLPILAHLVSVGAIVVSGRLVLNPGVFWAVDAPLWELCFAFILSIGLLIAARRFLSSPDSSANLVLHSASWSLAGIFSTILLFRAFDYFNLSSDFLAASLIATVWLILAFTQFYRMQGGTWMVWIRRGLGAVYLIIGCLLLGLSLSLLNPLFSGRAPGLPILNPILVAYGLPALIFAAMAVKLTHLQDMIRRAFGVIAGVLALLTVGLSIRHAWRRPDITLPGIEPGELYTYTVVMMIGAGSLLVIALQRKSPLLRRAAFFALGITAAKVFLIDASGLTGLIRVFAFLALGLTLAGLAWLNRRFGDDTVLTPDPDPDTNMQGGNDDQENAG